MSKANTGVLLAGRRTHQDFHGYWPHQTDNPFAEVLDNTQEHVAPTTLREPLPWSNSAVLEGDAADDPTLGDTSADFAEHIRTEHSTYRWLLEPMLTATGFDIVDASYRGRVYAAYTCRRRPKSVS